MTKFCFFLILLPLFSHAQVSPSEGYITGPVPEYGTYIAAKDPSGNLQALEIDATGKLIVTGTTVDNASVGLVGDPVPLSATYVAARNPSGDLEGLNVDGSGNLLIAGSIAVSNPSVGLNGDPAPTSSTLNGGIDGNGDLQGFSVNTSGELNINDISGTISLPTGASTSALQTTGNSTLADIETLLSSPLAVTQSGTWNVGLSAGANVIGAVTQSGTWNLNNISGTISLPTGASTETTLSALNGKLGSLGQKTMSGSAPVVLASDQAAIPVVAGVNPNGSYDQITNLTTSAQTFTKPANAVGFVIEALSDNTANVRYKIGASSTTSSGMRLEPGRSESYSNLAANISVIAETGSNQVVSVQWILSQ